MTKIKKNRPAKVKKVAEKISKNDPHLETNDKDMPDPFSFNLNATKKTVNKAFKVADEFKKTIQKNLSGNAAANNSVNNKTASNVKKTMDSYVNSTSSNIFNNTEATNPGTVFAERIINSITTSVSNALEKNTALGQDMLKCRDVKDCMSFQQKLFESNFTNMMNLCLDVSFAMQAFVSKNMQISSQYNDKGMKYLSGEII